MYTSCTFLQQVTAVTHACAQQVLFKQETFRIVVRLTYCGHAALLVHDDVRHRIAGGGITQCLAPRLFHAGGDVAVALFNGDTRLVPFQRRAAAEQQQSCDQNRGKGMWAQHVGLE